MRSPRAVGPDKPRMTIDSDASDTYAKPGRVTLWTLTKAGRTATCEAHALGLEVVTTVADDIVRTEVARAPDAAKRVADQWRRACEAMGWTG